MPGSYSSNGPLTPKSASTPSMPIASPTPSDLTVTQADLDQAWQTIVPPPFPVPAQYTSCYCEENIYLLTQHLASQLASVNLSASNIARQQRARFAPNGSRAVFVPIWDVHVVLMSNVGKTVLLYHQRASHLPRAGWPVIWDYHVVAVASCHLVPLQQLSRDTSGFAVPERGGWSRSWVYDFDSRLSHPGPEPVEWTEYNSHTFGEQTAVAEHFRARFRSVPAKLFEAHFASDRSHMRYDPPQPDGRLWHAEPPMWELIVGVEAGKEGIKNNLMEKYLDMTLTGGDERYGRVWEGKDWLGGECVPRGRVLGGSIGAVTSLGSAEGIGSGTNGAGSRTLVNRQSSPAAASATAMQPTVAQPTENVRMQGRMGGRIASPLFPAYLHASQQHRLPPTTHTSPS